MASATNAEVRAGRNNALSGRFKNACHSRVRDAFRRTHGFRLNSFAGQDAGNENRLALGVTERIAAVHEFDGRNFEGHGFDESSIAGRPPLAAHQRFEAATEFTNYK
jgi:hypothetical protein